MGHLNLSRFTLSPLRFFFFVELLSEPGSTDIKAHEDELQDAGKGPNQQGASPGRSHCHFLQVGGGPHETHAQLCYFLQQTVLPAYRDTAQQLTIFFIRDQDFEKPIALNEVYCSSCKRHDTVVRQTITLPGLTHIVRWIELSNGAADICYECNCLGTGLGTVSWAVQLWIQFGINKQASKSLTDTKALERMGRIHHKSFMSSRFQTVIFGSDHIKIK